MPSILAWPSKWNNKLAHTWLKPQNGKQETENNRRHAKTIKWSSGNRKQITAEKDGTTILSHRFPLCELGVLVRILGLFAIFELACVFKHSM